MIHRNVYLWLRGLRVARLLANANRAQSIQHRVLLTRIHRNAESQFARDYGLDGVKTVADFRRIMPVTTYSDYQSYIEQVKTGEKTAMFGRRSRLLMFALTSGTTSETKYIPVTGDFFREYRRGWNLWGVQTFRDHADLVRKHVVQLTSDWRQFYTDAGIPCGNISGLAAETAPRISDPIFILPRSLIKVADHATKQYIALRISVATSKVGMIVTANPSTLVDFARLANDKRDVLIRDIHDGTVTTEIELPSAVYESIQSRCKRKDPTRARELEQIVQRNGSLLPHDFWPELSVLALWTGGSVGAYLPRLKEYYGCTAFRDHGLSASEGRMTIPLHDGTSAGILDFAHHYFEFIPEDEADSSQPTILEAHELQQDRNYFILMTTSSGFYRYNIHDLVRCTGFHGQAPILEFLNKGSFFSSVTGEKLSEFQIVSAVGKAFNQMHLPIEHFTAAPIFGDPPGYVLLLEVGTWQNQADRLAHQIDRQLAQMNCEYANRLATGRLAALRIQSLPHGTWRAFRQRRIERLGGSLEQYKHPCLVNDLDFVQSLEELKPIAKLMAG